MNREYSSEIIEELLFLGVEEFYICAGARDIPLIEAVCAIKLGKPFADITLIGVQAGIT